MSTNEEFVLARRPEGAQDLKETWKLQQCEYPKITGEGQYIGQTLFVSVDPYLSGGIKKSALGGNVRDIGATQHSITILRVLESTHTGFPVGSLVMGTNFPWRKFVVITDSNNKSLFLKILKRPDEPENIFDSMGYHTALGVLGMPAQTAYFGILDVGKFKSTDILVVSGAAGAVGSVAGQIAKHVCKCKKVIGIAGGREKCELIVKEYGFDAAVDYKEYNTKDKLAARLKELAGDSITAYFDNTGGICTDAIFDIIGRFGRIVICGQISTYNKSEDNPEEANIYPNYLSKTVYRALSILGYTVSDYFPRVDTEFYPDITKWVESGQVKAKETIVEGFEKLPAAYEMLFTGANTGKVIVKV